MKLHTFFAQDIVSSIRVQVVFNSENRNENAVNWALNVLSNAIKNSIKAPSFAKCKYSRTRSLVEIFLLYQFVSATQFENSLHLFLSFLRLLKIKCWWRSSHLLKIKKETVIQIMYLLATLDYHTVLV